MARFEEKYANNNVGIVLKIWQFQVLPDVLGYNKHQHFFTVELKVTKGNKIRFSPHQIAFHVQHPKNTFILVKSLATRDWKLYEEKLFGSLQLAA